MILRINEKYFDGCKSLYPLDKEIFSYISNSEESISD